MLKTKLNSSTQIANSRNYNDAYAGAHSAATAQPPEHESTLEYDLNVIRTQIRQLKGGSSFFEEINNTPEDGYTLARVKGRLDNMEIFVGASDGTDSTPNYSSSLNFANGNSLTSALGKIDGYLGSVSAGFAGARILSSNSTIYDALQNLDDGYDSVQNQLDTFTLQRAYNQDPNGSDALITTNSTDGSVVIAGTQSLKIDATEGLDVDTKIDFDGSVFDVEMSASNGFSIDGKANSNVSVAGADLTLSTTSSGKVVVNAVGALDMDGASATLDTSGSISLDAGAASNFSTSAGDLDIAAAAELDLDGQTVKLNSSGQMDIGSGTDLNMSAAQDLDLDGTTFHLDASQDGYIGAAGSSLDIVAAGNLDMDAATVNLDSSSAMDLASGGAMKLDSASSLELEATGKLILDAQNGNADALDINSAGGIDIDSTGGFSLDSYSFSLDASNSSNVSTTNANLTLSTIGSGNLTLSAAGRMELKDSGLASSITLTKSETAITGWSAGIGEAAGSAGKDFSNFGLIEVTNALGDGYQSLSNELDAFTLQRAYNQGKALGSEDILITDGDSLNFRLAGNSASFQVSNDDGSRTLTVRDGYVQVDGYLLITGGTTQIETTVTDADHMLLSPIAGSAVPALKIDPATGFTQDLLVVEEVGTGVVAFAIENDGDAYFSNNVTMAGSLTSSTLILSPTGENVTSALRIDPYNGFTGDMLVVEEVGSNLPVFVIENDGDAYFAKNVNIEGSVSIKGGNTGTSISVEPSTGIAMETPQAIQMTTIINEFNYSSIEVNNNITTITSTTTINNEVNVSTVEVTNNYITQESTTINNVVKNDYNITVEENNVTYSTVNITNSEISYESTVINNTVTNEYNISTVDNSTTINVTNTKIENISQTINNTVNDYSISTTINNAPSPIVNIYNVQEGDSYVVNIENNSTYITNTSETIYNISETINNTVNDYSISTTINNAPSPIVNIYNVQEGDSYVVNIENNSTYITNTSETIYNYTTSVSNVSTTINNTSTNVYNISETINNTINDYSIRTTINNAPAPIVNITNVYEGDAYVVTIENNSTVINNISETVYNEVNEYNISTIINNTAAPVVNITNNVVNNNNIVTIQNTSNVINNISNTVYNEINDYNISTVINNSPTSIVEITNVGGAVTINNYGGEVNNYVNNEYNISTTINNSNVSIVNVVNDNDVITINNTSNTINNEIKNYNISTVTNAPAPVNVVEITNVYQGDAYTITINNTSSVVNNNISTVYNTSTTINNNSTTINNISNSVYNEVNNYEISTTYVATPIVEITNVYQGDAYVITINNSSTAINNSVSNNYNISTTINNNDAYVVNITNNNNSVTISNTSTTINNTSSVVNNNVTNVYNTSETINNTINEYNISTITTNINPVSVVEVTNVYSPVDGYTITINNTSTNINNTINNEYNIVTNYEDNDIEIVNIINNAGSVTITNTSEITYNNFTNVTNTSTTINNVSTTINNVVENYNINTTNNYSTVYIDDSYTSIYSPTININTTEVTNITVADSYFVMTDGYISATSSEISLDSYGELYLSDVRSAATGNAKGAFRLSTTATDLSGIVRGLANVAEGQELGIIDAINALATNVGSFEKAVYKITANDSRLSNGGRTLALANPTKGSLDLVDNSEGYSPDFDPSRDLEVYVNGQYMLVDSGVSLFPASPEDDCYLENSHTKITFAFALEAQDTVIIKNLKPKAGEDTSWPTI